MVIVDKGEYCRVYNIDFGNAFTTDYTINKEITKPDNLIKQIYYMVKERMIHHRDNSYYDALMGIADTKEIGSTIEKIAQLKDQDLTRMSELLSQMVDSKGNKMINDNLQNDYLEYLKFKRNKMVKLNNDINNDIKLTYRTDNSEFTTPVDTNQIIKKNPRRTILDYFKKKSETVKQTDADQNKEMTHERKNGGQTNGRTIGKKRTHAVISKINKKLKQPDIKNNDTKEFTPNKKVKREEVNDSISYKQLKREDAKER